MRWLLALGLVAAAGCGRSEEAQEADRVARAIDLVRDAPNDPVEARRKLLDALEAERPKGVLAQGAQRACAEAYRPFLEGQSLEASVRARLAGKPEELDPSVLTDLATAEQKVAESKAKMPDCDRALHDLKHAFR